MIKRSLSIHGHRTSLALEAEFWTVIDAAVEASGKSFARFIRDLDDIRTENGTEQNLASYLRVWVLKRVQEHAP
ncbi:ribbon-helix-helix domain-containing protein [Hellea sp.]|nr:ribbon-helix-helix domain-containing protein [Hellea sp.]